MVVAQEKTDARSLSRLKWRCRRGLLENDLFIERFFARHEQTLTVGQARGLEALMELADNDLLDLLLRRREPDAGLDGDAVREVLALLRTDAAPSVHSQPPMVQGTGYHPEEDRK